MSDYREADYPCVGICMDDPDTGYCIGCGRPPWPVVNRSQPHDVVAAGSVGETEETDATAAIALAT